MALDRLGNVVTAGVVYALAGTCRRIDGNAVLLVLGTDSDNAIRCASNDIVKVDDTTAGGGGGTVVKVNTVAVAANADLTDGTPAPPANSINVKWQKDGGSPTEKVSANVPYGASLTVAATVLERATLTGDVASAAGVNSVQVIACESTGASAARLAFALINDGETLKRSGTTIIGYVPPAPVLTDADYTDITVSGSGSIMTIDVNTVTFAKMQDIATDKLIGRDTAGTGDPEEISVSGGLEFTGAGGIRRSALTGAVTAPAGSNNTTLAVGIVGFVNIQDMSAHVLLGNPTNIDPSTPQEVQVDASLVFDGVTTLQRAAISGDVTIALGSNVAAIGANKVALAQMAQVATARFLGRVTAGTGDVEAMTGAQATTLIDTFTATLKGAVPAPTVASKTKVLRDDATWADASSFDLDEENQLPELQRKFRLLLKAWITTGLPIPLGLEDEAPMALAQE